MANTKVFLHLTKTGDPSSQSHCSLIFDIPKYRNPSWTVLLEIYICNSIAVWAVLGIISWADGFRAWQACWAAVLLAAVATRATQPCWSNQSNPVGQTEISYLFSSNVIIWACTMDPYYTLEQSKNRLKDFASKKKVVRKVYTIKCLNKLTQKFFN